MPVPPYREVKADARMTRTYSWHRLMDSNHNEQFWRLPCYRYIKPTGVKAASSNQKRIKAQYVEPPLEPPVGIEPT